MNEEASVECYIRTHTELGPSDREAVLGGSWHIVALSVYTDSDKSICYLRRRTYTSFRRFFLYLYTRDRYYNSSPNLHSRIRVKKKQDENIILFFLVYSFVFRNYLLSVRGTTLTIFLRVVVPSKFVFRFVPNFTIPSTRAERV